MKEKSVNWRDWYRIQTIKIEHFNSHVMFKCFRFKHSDESMIAKIV